MSLSIPKCKTLNISRKKLRPSREYLLDGTLLTTVSETINLGITITDNLQWSQHIKQISLKANRTLGLIRRICRDISDTNTRKLFYCSIVRPKLEYACELWSPCTCKDKLLLENVQRRATKFILTYPKDMSYKDRLLKLNLLQLEYRRNFKDLVLIFKAWAGHADLGHHDFFRQTEIHHRMRNACKFNYHIPCAKQRYLKHSFYYRSIAAWNKLPVDIKSTNQSLSSFKKSISDIYTHNTLSYVLPTSGVYDDIYMCLLMGKGANGGSAIYGFVWGKIATGTLSCLLLQLQY